MSHPPPSQVLSTETLYRDHNSWLRNWLRRKLGCSHLAADLAQDTYVRLMSAGTTPGVADSRRYLARIANGLVIDLYRRRHVEAAYLESVRHLPEAEVPGSETRLLIIETLLEIDAMLDGLPAKVRQAFLLRQLDACSYREIAAQMAVSVSSVEKYVAQGLAACYTALHGEPV